MKKLRGAAVVREMHAIHEAAFPPRRIHETWWFREAMLVVAEPVAFFAADGRALFLMEDDDRRWLLGSELAEGVDWPFTPAQRTEVEDSGLFAFGDGEGRLGPFRTEPTAGEVFLDGDHDGLTELALPYGSWDEYARAVWRADDRNQHARQTRGFRDRLTVRWEPHLGFADYAWLIDRSCGAAERRAERSSYQSGPYRAAFWNLSRALAARGHLAVLRLLDGDRRVAVCVCMVDRELGRWAGMPLFHGLHEEYASIGKYLFELVLRQAFAWQVRAVGCTYELTAQKKKFRFGVVPTWEVRTGKE